MLLAQTSADPVSLAAVAIALLSLVWTIWQGSAIRDIQTREHDWQAEDRLSAHIEVTRISETTPRTVRKSSGNETHYSTSDRIRLRNTGRAQARNVEWEMESDHVLLWERRDLDVLYPGEHYDLLIAMAMSDPPETLFTVRWTDGNGAHESKRMINL